MNSGIYIRVGKENKLLEQMTNEERHEWLEKFIIKEPLIKCIDILSQVLKNYEDGDANGQIIEVKQYGLK